MLYGVRPGLQDKMLEAGDPLRIYVPYGAAWYPYLTRRMAERPGQRRVLSSGADVPRVTMPGLVRTLRAPHMYDGPMNWLRRTGFSALLAAMALLLGATVASAATVSEVVDDAAVTGFHLDNDVTITASDATGIVSAARNNGSRFYLVVLEDTPLGGNTAFAEAVLDDLGVDSGRFW